jgi:hypothetical protein
MKIATRAVGEPRKKLPSLINRIDRWLEDDFEKWKTKNEKQTRTVIGTML